MNRRVHANLFFCCLNLKGVHMYGKVLSAATVPSAVVLPNTGANRALTIAATTTLVVGIIATITTIARLVAKKAYKA